MSDVLFTSDLRMALARQAGNPLRVVDRDINLAYWIIPAEMFDRSGGRCL